MQEAAGPKLQPLRTKEAIDHMKIQSDWAKTMPFVKQTLGDLRKEVRSLYASSSRTLLLLLHAKMSCLSSHLVLHF